MSTNKVASPNSTSSPPPSQGSSLRLIVLLGILFVAVGALAYDYYAAKPAWEAGDKNIHEMVEARNKMGVKDAALVTSVDVQKVLGRAPTITKENDKDNYTVEYYCWWGNVPVINLRRRFIAVVYVGNKPRHYSSHYREEPPAEAYPLIDRNVPTDEGEKASDKSEKPAEDAGKKPEDSPKEGDKKEGDKAKENEGEKAKGKEGEKSEGDKAKEGDKPKEGDKAADGKADGESERGIGFRR